METPTQPTAFDAVPEGFDRLEPLQLNAVTFSAQRTVITPEVLDQLADAAPSDNKG